MAVKYRDGYNSLGRQGAAYVGASDEFATTRRRVGVMAKKCGDFIQVFQEPDTDVAAVYSVGRNAAGEWQVRGAANASGTFGYVGVPQSGGTLIPNVFSYGRGLLGSAQLVAATPASVNDFNGTAWQQATFQLTRSRRGVDPDGYYAVDTVSPNFILGSSNFLIEFIPYGYRNVAGVPTFYTGASVTQMVAVGQPAHKFIVDNGTTFGFGATLGYSNAAAFFANNFTLAPGVLMKMDRYLRAGAPYTTTPVAVFTYSLDAGATWTAAPSPALLATELATVNALTTSTGDLALFNLAAQSLRVIAAPLSRATSVVLAVVPYIAAGAVKARVKMGQLDATTFAMTGSVVLYDGLPDDALAFLKDIMAVDGGVLVFTRPMTPDTAVWGRPAKVQKTTDGVSLADVGFLPFNENRVGVCRALSTTRLVLPVYDAGAYRLYQTTTQGASWTERAVIAADGYPPPGGRNLLDFADVAYPRQGDVAANSFPATPWLTDIRIDP